MRNTLVLLAGAVAVLASAIAGRADELTMAEVFERAGAATGVEYVTGRERLLARGEALDSLIAAHADDPRAGHRALADLLRLHRTSKSEVTAWKEAMGRPSLAIVDLDPPHVVVLRSSQGSARVAHVREVRFTRAALPLVIDALRAHGDRREVANASQLVAGFQFTEAVPWLAPLLGEFDVADGLAANRAAAAPHVVAALEDRTNESRFESAAALASRLRLAAATPLLLRALNDASHPRQLDAPTRALVAVDPLAGARRVLARLLASEPAWPGRTPSGYVHYRDLRSALLAFGESAQEAIRERLRSDPPLRERIVLDGMAWELENPDDAKAAYARARSVWHRDFWFSLDDDSEDRAAADERIGRYLVWEHGSAGLEMPAALQMELAVNGDRHALVREARRGARHGVKVVNAALSGRYPPGECADVVFAFAEKDPEMALLTLAELVVRNSPQDLDRALEVTLVQPLGLRTIAVLERVLQEAAKAPTDAPPGEGTSPHVRAAPLARAALAAAREGRPLASLLGHEDRGVALAAARALVRSGDRAGVPLVVEAALAATRSRDYRELRALIVGAGVVPEWPLGDARRRVFSQAVACRITHPEVAAATDVALRLAQPSSIGHSDPGPDEYERAGEVLARRLDRSTLPLLEEAALFLGNDVAAAALDALAGESASRARSPWRTSRADAVDEALAALGAPRPSSEEEIGRWRERVAASLSAAALAADPRLVEPTLRLLDRYGHEDAGIEAAAHAVLVEMRDDRVAAGILDYLRASDDDGGPNWKDALVEILGPRVVPFLLERADTGPMERRERAVALETLVESVVAPPSTRAQRDATARLLRAELESAIAVVADADTTAAAADAADRWARLLLYVHASRPDAERSQEDLDAVLGFVATQPHPGRVAGALEHWRPPGAGAALLASYRLDHDGSALGALRTLGHEDAVPAVRAEAERRFGERPTPGGYELGTLAFLGAAGRAAAREILVGDHPLAVRSAVVWTLGEVRDPKAFHPLLALLREWPDESVGEALRRIDPELAFTVVARLLVASDAEEARIALARILARYRRLDPELSDRNPPLRRE